MTGTVRVKHSVCLSLSYSGSHSFDMPIHEDSTAEEQEEKEEMEMDHHTEPASHTRRIGPGYSVVDQSASNETAAQFQRLASQIEAIVEEDDEEFGEEQPVRQWKFQKLRRLNW